MTGICQSGLKKTTPRSRCFHFVFRPAIVSVGTRIASVLKDPAVRFVFRIPVFPSRLFPGRRFFVAHL